MPGYQVPTAFTAGRKLTINGTVYQPGADVPVAVAKACRNLSALTSNRSLIPTPDPWRRRTKPITGTPSDIPAVVRKGL